MKVPSPISYDNSSYENPKPGKYLGRIVRIADIGKQPTTKPEYKPMRNIRIGWELSQEVRVKVGNKYTLEVQPSLDSEGRPHIAYQNYTFSLSSKANLRDVVEAHLPEPIIFEDKKNGIAGRGDDTQDWMGLAAILDLKGSDATDDNGNPKYVNVANVSRLGADQEVPEATLPFEHWDDSDAANGVPVPTWANFWVGRSLDLSHLAKPRESKGKATGNGSGADRQPPFTPGSQPRQPAGNRPLDDEPAF